MENFILSNIPSIIVGIIVIIIYIIKTQSVQNKVLEELNNRIYELEDTLGNNN